MEPRIKSRFNDEILNEILTRYDIDRTNLDELDGFESFIYEYRKDGNSYILRIGHSNRRPGNLVQAEADWINYLVDGGVGASRALPSSLGNLVETVDDAEGENFVATAFEKAPGKPPHEIGWNEERQLAYGRLIGRMHTVTKSYIPTTPGCRREEWDSDVADTTLKFLPAEDEDVAARYQAAMTAVNTLPKTKDNYGLIHFDAHSGNFFMTEDNQLTLFDFDDSAYSWYINDVAMVLFYKVKNLPDKATHTAEFMPHFLRGYRAEAELPADWLGTLPLFMKLREIDLYAVIKRDFTPAEVAENNWLRTFMHGRREAILNDVPYVEFDWGSLA